MSVSPINIVVSFDPEAMLAFQKAGSLTAFKDYKKTQRSPDPGGQQIFFSKGTHIFDNISPNSNFISLSHTFGMAKGMELQIELIDPNGVFEKTLLDNAVETWWPAKANPVFERLLKNTDDIKVVRGELNDLNAHPARRSGPTRENLPNILNLSTEITLLTEKLQTLYKYKDDLLKLENRLDRKVTMQRPIYVTYGVGNNLENWSPLQCYGKIIRLEYSFNGSGVRVIKLILLGLGAHPSLTQEGLSVLGRSFTAGLLTQGTSDLVFNAQATEKFINQVITKTSGPKGIEGEEVNRTVDWYEQTKGEDEVKKLLKDPLRPSLHLAITQALTDFIRKGINDENVYVLLPDLDKALKPNIDLALEKVRQKIKPYNPIEKFSDVSPPPGDRELTKKEHTRTALYLPDIHYFEAFQIVIESLGFSLCESSYSLSPVGANVNQELESIYRAEVDVDMPGDPVPAWFQARKFRVAIQCKYEHITFLDKLKQIAELLEKEITLGGEGSPIMMRAPQAETDFLALRHMKRAGLIPRTDKPLIYWGDSNLISSYLYGRAIETAEYDRPEATMESGPDGNVIITMQDIANLSTKLETRERSGISGLGTNMGVRHLLWEVIHPIDRLNGLDINYMKNQVDVSYLNPNKLVSQPFGPTATDLFDRDTKKLYRELKKNKNFFSSRMPLFTFGDKNPNILNIDFDINAIYTTAMFDAIPRPSTYSQRTNALQLRNSKTGINFVNTVIDDLLKISAESGFVSIINSQVDNLPTAMGDPSKWAVMIGEGDIPDEFKTAIETFIAKQAGVYMPDDPGMQSWTAYQARAAITKSDAGAATAKMAEKMVATQSLRFARGFTEDPEFLRYMWKYFVTNHLTATNKRMYTPGIPISNVIKNSARLQQRLIRDVMTGSITTVPFFHLSSMRRTFYRPCLVKCVEPSITLNEQDEKYKRDNFTWFSGLYEITGFKHTITSSRASSQFSIVKGINSSLMTKDKRGDIMKGIMSGNDHYSK